MSERKPPYGSRIKNRSTVPKAAIPFEEPLRGIEPGKFACQICGKTFKTKSALDRHKETEHEHGTPERIL
jgi:C2H2-type zinc finger